MRDLAVLFLHLLATVARLAGPGGALVMDEPIVIHCYTTPVDIEDPENLAQLGSFCRTMERESRQGENRPGGRRRVLRKSATFLRNRTMKTELDMDKIAEGLGSSGPLPPAGLRPGSGPKSTSPTTRSVDASAPWVHGLN